LAWRFEKPDPASEDRRPGRLKIVPP